MIRFKWLSFLTKSEEKIKAYESWSVRWVSLHYSGYSYAERRHEAEVFTSKEDAERFVDSLKAARILLKDSEIKFSIEKN